MSNQCFTTSRLIRTTVFALGCLILLTFATTPLWAEGIKVTLKSADSGKYAARCNNCVPGGAYPDNVSVHVTDPKAAYAQWILEKLDNGYYTLKSVDSGKYFTRCNNCVPGGAYPDNATVHVTAPPGRFAQWKLEKLANGNYTLKCADSGKYAARCNNCVPKGAYPDNVFVHVDNSSKAYAQWEISIVP